jgi:uncharacterized protein YeaO (DUF488 family)
VATITGQRGERKPSENELNAARFQGEHVTRIATKLAERERQSAKSNVVPGLVSKFMGDGIDMIKTVRVYGAHEERGYRILVDRLWPRGLSKENVKFDLWLKEIGPSNELRKWFGHDPGRYNEFKKKFFGELDGKKELVEQIIKKAGRVHPAFRRQRRRA